MSPEPSRPPANGLLAIWHDVARGCESLVSDWYNQEHHAERLAVPGFLSAQRYERASGDGAAIMTLYRTASPEVFWSPPYRERLQAPSDRTRVVMPSFRNMCRTTCCLAWSDGAADGGAVAVLAVAALPGTTLAMPAALPVLPAMPGVLSCRWIVRVAPPQAVASSAEHHLRGAADSEITWALLVDANHDDQAVEALSRFESLIGPLPAAAAVRVRQRACYRLVYASWR